MNKSKYSRETGSSKVVGLVVGGVVLLIAIVAAIYLVDVDQTKEIRLPTVDVDVNEGQMPKYDVDVADIDVGSKEVSVDVPKFDVETKTVEVEVPTDVDIESESMSFDLPTISVEQPDQDDPADN